jgi:membrane-associated phospholipid phosphatase
MRASGRLARVAARRLPSAPIPGIVWTTGMCDGGRSAVRLNAIILGVALLCGPALARAGEPGSGCRPDEWRGARASLLGVHDASIDLYNGLLYTSAAAVVAAAADPPHDPRWSSVNDFDDAFRDAFKLSGRSSRDAGATASDVFWGVTMAAPLLADGFKSWSDGHCDRAFGVSSGWLESMGLTALLVTSTKVVAARERPRGDDRESFFSGHAALSATGAGLLCRHSVKDQIWGSSTLDKALPCGLGVAAAMTTGLLRVAADKHWMTDVLVSWGVGGLIGYFDLPGPFDLLRFRVRDEHGAPRAEGFVAPYARNDAVGARLSMQFR